MSRARHAHHSRPQLAVACIAFLWGVAVLARPRRLSSGLEPIATAFSALIMGSDYTAIDIVGMALIIGAVVTIPLSTSTPGAPRASHNRAVLP